MNNMYPDQVLRLFKPAGRHLSCALQAPARPGCTIVQQLTGEPAASPDALSSCCFSCRKGSMGPRYTSAADAHVSEQDVSYTGPPQWRQMLPVCLSDPTTTASRASLSMPGSGPDSHLSCIWRAANDPQQASVCPAGKNWPSLWSFWNLLRARAQASAEAAQRSHDEGFGADGGPSGPQAAAGVGALGKLMHTGRGHSILTQQSIQVGAAVHMRGCRSEAPEPSGGCSSGRCEAARARRQGGQWNSPTSHESRRPVPKWRMPDAVCSPDCRHICGTCLSHYQLWCCPVLTGLSSTVGGLPRPMQLFTSLSFTPFSFTSLPFSQGLLTASHLQCAALQAFRESLAADVLQPHAQRGGSSFQPPRVQDLTLYSNPHQQPLLFVDDSQAPDCQMQPVGEVRFCVCPQRMAAMGRHQLCVCLPGEVVMRGRT